MAFLVLEKLLDWLAMAHPCTAAVAQAVKQRLLTATYKDVPSASDFTNKPDYRQPLPELWETLKLHAVTYACRSTYFKLEALNGTALNEFKTVGKLGFAALETLQQVSVLQPTMASHTPAALLQTLSCASSASSVYPTSPPLSDAASLPPPPLSPSFRCCPLSYPVAPCAHPPAPPPPLSPFFPPSVRPHPLLRPHIKPTPYSPLKPNPPHTACDV